MACWRRDLSLPQMIIAACKDPSAGPRGSSHAECYKGSCNSFRVIEELLDLEPLRMLNDHLSRWAMPRIAMAYFHGNWTNVFHKNIYWKDFGETCERWQILWKMWYNWNVWKTCEVRPICVILSKIMSYFVKSNVKYDVFYVNIYMKYFVLF